MLPSFSATGHLLRSSTVAYTTHVISRRNRRSLLQKAQDPTRMRLLSKQEKYVPFYLPSRKALMTKQSQLNVGLDNRRDEIPHFPDLPPSGNGSDMPNNRCSKCISRRIECTYLLGQVRKFFGFCYFCRTQRSHRSEQQLSQKVSSQSAATLSHPVSLSTVFDGAVGEPG